MLNRLTRWCLPGLALLLAACQGYDFRVNDKVVYTPPPLLSEFQVADEALRNCLGQAIVDQSARELQDLHTLNCSHAGIHSLEGLAAFSALTRLRLSSNAIADLSELGAMPALRELYLDGNRIEDAAPLTALTALETLELADNPSLRCPAAGVFADIAQLTLPAHCN